MSSIALSLLSMEYEAKPYYLLTQFSSSEYALLHEDLPYKGMCSVQTKQWYLAFDGSSAHWAGRAGFVLYDPNGTNGSLFSRLEFSCVIGLVSASHMGIWNFGGSEIQSSSFDKPKRRICLQRDCVYLLRIVVQRVINLSRAFIPSTSIDRTISMQTL